MKTKLDSMCAKYRFGNLAKVVLILLLVLSAVQGTQAENVVLPENVQQNKSESAVEYKQRIEQILQQKEFNNKKTVKKWRLKDLKNKEERKGKFPEWIIKIIEFFERNENAFVEFSKIVEFLLWVVFVSTIIYLLYRYRESIAELVHRIKRKPAKAELPSKMFGLDVRKDSLPENIAQQAKQNWEAGDEREALSLLFRAALSKLLHDYDCQFQDGDTETECCNEVAKLQNKKLTKFMQNLTVVWQQLAYAHIKPTKAIFNQLCKQWSEVF